MPKAGQGSGLTPPCPGLPARPPPTLLGAPCRSLHVAPEMLLSPPFIGRDKAMESVLVWPSWQPWSSACPLLTGRASKTRRWAKSLLPSQDRTGQAPAFVAAPGEARFGGVAAAAVLHLCGERQAGRPLPCCEGRELCTLPATAHPSSCQRSQRGRVEAPCPAPPPALTGGWEGAASRAGWSPGRAPQWPWRGVAGQARRPQGPVTAGAGGLGEPSGREAG